MRLLLRPSPNRTLDGNFKPSQPPRPPKGKDKLHVRGSEFLLTCEPGHPAQLELKPRLILLLAHLGKIRARPGSRVRAGQLLGNVGGPTNNGNWFPHLHAQIVRGRFANVDGYGAFSVDNQRKFPDPLRFWPPQYDSTRT
jgi:hypothetical protein